jgi:hypothetical protein
VCESELGHERQGIALVDSIAADLDAPRPKESVAGVAAITIAAAPLVRQSYVINLVGHSARLSGRYHCGLDRLAWIWIASLY